MYKKEIKIFILFTIISILISPLRSGEISIANLSGFTLSSFIGFIIYYWITFYIFRKGASQYTLISIITGISILNLPIRIINFEETLISLLELLIQLTAPICGYLTYKVKHPYRYFFGISAICIAYILSTNGYQLWVHKLNFGTFTGHITSIQKQEYSFQTPQGDIINLSNLKGKPIILDFWNSRCGYCYQQLPIIQELHDKYTKENEVLIYSVHVYYNGENYSSGDSILIQKGYKLPTLSISHDSPLLNQLMIKTYPTILLIDKSGNMIYRGHLDKAIQQLQKLNKNTDN